MFSLSLPSDRKKNVSFSLFPFKLSFRSQKNIIRENWERIGIKGDRGEFSDPLALQKIGAVKSRSLESLDDGAGDFFFSEE